MWSDLTNIGLEREGERGRREGREGRERERKEEISRFQKEVKRPWKLKRSEIVPVIIEAAGRMNKNLTEILKTIPGNISTNKLQLEAVLGSVTILKRALGTKL